MSRATLGGGGRAFRATPPELVFPRGLGAALPGSVSPWPSSARSLRPNPSNTCATLGTSSCARLGSMRRTWCGWLETSRSSRSCTTSLQRATREEVVTADQRRPPLASTSYRTIDEWLREILRREEENRVQ
jgi:hypothetical protein